MVALVYKPVDSARIRTYDPLVPETAWKPGFFLRKYAATRLALPRRFDLSRGLTLIGPRNYFRPRVFQHFNPLYFINSSGIVGRVKICHYRNEKVPPIFDPTALGVL